MAQQEEDGGQRRPIGWWLKEADRRLDAAFERVLQGEGVDRRAWQVLASLAGGPSEAARLRTSLTAFDDAGRVDAVVADLTARGWIEATGGQLQLSDEGRTRQLALSELVGEVRQQVAAALPGRDYSVLVGLLGALVSALPDSAEPSTAAGGRSARGSWWMNP